MTETTGSATGLEDFFAKFLTHVATLSGWTVDQSITTVDSGRQCAISKGNLFVQYRWDTASPDTVAVYQSTAFDGVGVRAGLHTGDSGNGYNSSNGTTEANLESERCVQNMGNSAYPNYYIYTDASATYIHVAVEVNTDELRHFGCGNTSKFGDWDTMSGGEYVYGHNGVTFSSALSQSGNCLLDGAQITASGSFNQNDQGGTMRLAGAPNQDGAGVWAHVWGAKDRVELNDSAGNPRAKVMGGSRGGLLARAFGFYGPGSTTGIAPLTPNLLTYLDQSTSPPRAYILGFQPDVRTIHLRYLAQGDTFTLGGDTWRVFPWVRRVEGAAAGDTDFLGFAYKT